MQRWWRCGAGVLVAGILAGCGSTADEEQQADIPVQVSIATLHSVELTVSDDLPGRVAALRVAEIRPQTSGIVQKRLFGQGAEIRAGQALFQIDPAPLRAEADIAAAALRRAETAYASARVRTARLAPLVEADALSRQAYDDALMHRDQAAADVAQARATATRRRLDLKFATVTAPIAGRIDQALVTEGALVGPNDGTPLARVQQIDQVYVDVRQPAAALETLRDALDAGSRGTAGGQRASATILRSSGDPYPFAARVLFSGIDVDAGTGDVLLRILVDNPRRALLPGMYVQARLPRARYDSALMVPQQAVVRAGGETTVWVIDAENRAHAAPVTLGELVGQRYRVGDGLHAGQHIVVEGLARLAEGMTVVPQPWRAADVATTATTAATTTAPAPATATATAAPGR
ncbi:MAG: efflux RND transporter periplasmic adaptor subunit [Janthinobacterium lividum]